MELYDACLQPETIARFWSRVRKPEDDGCWTWITREKRRHAYGRFVVRLARGQRSIVIASRYSWMIANGPIPEGVEICHLCDNPACVRPDHLYAGSHAQNMRDMKERNRASNGESRSRILRATIPRGSKHRFSLLTEKDIPVIRQCRSQGATLVNLGREYGVTQECIYSVVKRRTWKHVP